jgi:putative lipoprotein (rSAM/lipoprotein system)
MKKAKIRFYKTSNAIILGLLALLGFSTSCNIIRYEYGTPQADFIVKGKVTSSTTGNPIQNIRVIMKRDSTNPYGPGDTTFTDNEGNYHETLSAFPKNQTFQLVFQDVDSAANGDYQGKDTTVQFTDPKFNGGDGSWYKGETSKNLNIKLDKK